ncbi:FkbM family methyltransferase [Pedobacter sp. KLB.chiD]|uniref:FkbM family methyltransferase n=1 Tax=Pedobacter sp. KLB.chiD TaxID=3387402 RepID=UPI00399B624D
MGLFNKIILRLNNFLQKKKRLNKLKHTPAKDLHSGHIDSLELLELIQSEAQINVIVDIGANTGTWTLLAKSIFSNAQIYAFEPLEFCRLEFEKNTKVLDNINLYLKAVGNENITSKINLNSFADASSILNATPLLHSSFQIKELDKLVIQIVKLDDFFKQEGLLQPDLIKLDIQGYELEALKGAVMLLSSVKYIIMEVSFIEYYKNQPLFEEVILFMNSNYFKVKAFGENLRNGKNLTQVDILFVNHQS